MPSTWSDYKIQYMATGENSTTWGNITNENFASFSEMITGSADVTFASGTVTLTLADSTATQTARNLRLNLTGTSGGAQNLIVPAIEKLYLVNNGCADAITVKNSTGTGIAVPAGKTMWVFNNATNVVDVVTHLSSLTLGSALPQASGGTGQTSTQLTQYCGVGVWGTATRLDVTLPAGGVYAQTAGARVSFTVPTANPAGTITLKVGANAAATILNSDGSAVNINDLATSVVYTAVFDGTFFQLQNPTASVVNKYAQINSGVISGYICSNTVAFPNTRLDISVGNCRDTTNVYSIQLATGITKRLDAVWAAGTNNGGRDTATALASGQTWHVFAILDPTTPVTDVLFSQSATAPTLPAGYTVFRRIMSVVLDTSTFIKQFVQTGSYIQLKTRNAEFSATTNAVAAGTLRNMLVPLGLKLRLDIYFQTQGDTTSATYFSGLYDPDVGVPNGTLATAGNARWSQFRIVANSSETRYQTQMVQVYTNTNAQIYTASTDPLETIAGGVVGWLDPRDSYY